MMTRDVLAGLIVAGFVATLAVLGWGARRFLARMDGRFDEIGQLKTQVTAMQGQYRNNGGSTMRDAVDRIERSQTATADAVAAIRTDLTSHLIESAGDHARLTDHLSTGGHA